MPNPLLSVRIDDDRQKRYRAAARKAKQPDVSSWARSVLDAAADVERSSTASRPAPRSQARAKASESQQQRATRQGAKSGTKGSSTKACTHPRSKRKNLGYATRCEQCGGLIK